MKPIDVITNPLNATRTDAGSSQDKQVLSMAAAAVYGQAYNAARHRSQMPVDARAEARAAAEDFINMDFNRK